jgi:hypothetical protein
MITGINVAIKAGINVTYKLTNLVMRESSETSMEEREACLVSASCLTYKDISRSTNKADSINSK